jgi:wobble nucleotide-excising tRNase
LIAKLSLHHVGLFNLFEMGENPECSYFSKYNLIYGYNGSGKSTISRVLRFLEHASQINHPNRKEEAQQQINSILEDLRPTHSEMPANFTVFSNGQKITPQNYRSVSIPPIRVFNADFIEETIDIRRGKTKEAIIFLGKKQQNLKSRLDKLKDLQAKLKKSVKEKNTAKDTAEKEKKNWATNRAKEIAEKISATSRSFESPHFLKAIPDSNPLSDGQCKQCVADVTQKEIEQLPENKLLPDLRLSQKFSELKNFLAQTPQSATIEKLKNNSGIETWVREGFRNHHKKGDTCAFCDNSISDARWDELSGHFSEAYEELRQAIESKKKEFEELVQLIEENTNKYPDSAQFYPAFKDEFSEKKAALNDATKALQPLIQNLINVCDRKLGALNQKVECNTSEQNIQDTERLIVAAFSEYNALLGRNAKHSESIKQTAENARKELIGHYCFYDREKLDAYDKEIEGREILKKERQATLENIEAALRETQVQINQTGEAATAISKDVAEFLGHKTFTLEPAPHGEGGYVIKRNGHRAKQLSEGERTVLAIVFFTQKLQEESFDLSKGIVVVDDPISSLDAKSLYMAYSYINEHIGKKAAQFFLLTHNDRFMYEWKRAFDYPPYKNKSEFFMASTHLKNSHRQTVLRKMPALLKDHESEYHYIFKTLYEFCHLDHDLSSEKDIYHYPNMARKMWEIVCKWKFPKTASKDGVGPLEIIEKKYGVEKYVHHLQQCRLFNAQSHKNIDALDCPDWSAYHEFKETCKALCMSSPHLRQIW